MSIRSAAAAALYAALPAAATAQSLPPIPNTPPAAVAAPADPPARLPSVLPELVPPAPASAPAPGGPPGDVWTRFEWLYWVGSRQPLPPLVTTAPPGTPPFAAGVAGLPTTLTAFGGRANNDFRNGFRAAAGTWVNDARTFGVEADFFFLGRSADGFAASSVASDVLTRPFVNAATGRPAAAPVALPGIAAGSVAVQSTNSAIGGGLFGLVNICQNPCGDRLDYVFGFRYFHVGDLVTVQNSVTSFSPALPVPTGLAASLTDRFGTSNDYYGKVIGLSGEKRLGSFFVGGRATVAFGGVVETTRIDGTTAVGPVVVPGGFLAQPTNAGTHRHERFAVMPELGVRGGYQITPNARIYGGYDFLYLSRVARAGDQIDLAVNPTVLARAPLVGPPAPTFSNKQTDFWLQGVNLGVELRY